MRYASIKAHQPAQRPPKPCVRCSSPACPDVLGCVCAFHARRCALACSPPPHARGDPTSKARHSPDTMGPHRVLNVHAEAHRLSVQCSYEQAWEGKQNPPSHATTVVPRPTVPGSQTHCRALHMSLCCLVHERPCSYWHEELGAGCMRCLAPIYGLPASRLVLLGHTAHMEHVVAADEHLAQHAD